MITRLIFCAPYRIPTACVSLHFDHNLIGVSRNIIVSPMKSRDLFRYLSAHGIDTNRFEHIHDGELEYCYPEIQNWMMPGDYRGSWLKQQALKLAALDYIDYKVALIHDPDTWLIHPYQCYSNSKMQRMLVLENTTESSYDNMLPQVLNMPRQTEHCFVTELMPVTDLDFESLKSNLESLHHKDFLTSIIEQVPSLSTVDGSQELKWFSEYEFLGNWTLTQRPVEYMFQTRFEFNDVEQLVNLDINNYNSICDQSSGNNLALRFDDWHTGVISNYDRCMELLQNKLLCM